MVNLFECKQIMLFCFILGQYFIIQHNGKSEYFYHTIKVGILVISKQYLQKHHNPVIKVEEEMFT